MDKPVAFGSVEDVFNRCGETWTWGVCSVLLTCMDGWVKIDVGEKMLRFDNCCTYTTIISRESQWGF